MNLQDIKKEFTSCSIICRLCLTEGSTYLNIIEDVSIGQELVAALYSLGIIISSNDNWPKTICTGCVNKIQDFLTLLRRIRQNESRLGEIFGDYQLQIPEVDFFDVKDDAFDADLGVKSEDEELQTTAIDTVEDKPAEVKKESPHKKTKRSRKKEKSETEKKKIAEVNLFYRMECKDCNTTFPCFSEVQKHFRQQHRCRGYIVCCRGKLTSPKRLYDHMMNHKYPDNACIECSICKKIFKNPQILKSHMKLQHTPVEERKFCCDKCPKRFTLESVLKKHRDITHMQKEDKKHICATCGHASPTKSTLMTHIRRVHKNACISVCDICAKVYRDKSNFTKHMLKHKNELKRNIPCPECGKLFQTRNTLRKHVQLHDTSGCLECSFCGHKSINQAALKAHIQRNHLRKKIHKCTICEKTFNRPRHLKDHIASHTGQVRYECKYCLKEFISYGNYYNHKKSSHPDEWQAEKAERMAKAALHPPE